MKNILFVLTCFLLSSGCVFAADKEPWTFSVVPYFWGVNINGDIEVGVPAEGIENQLLHISENFSSIWNHIHNGAMLDLNATKGNFGLFLNGMYVSIKNLNVTTSDGFDVDVNTKFGLYSVGAFYRPIGCDYNQYSKIRLGPYIGVRYTRNESSAALVEAPEYNDSHEARWTDPYLGATLLFELNRYWAIELAADVGGLKHTQDSYNLIGLIKYEPIENLGIYFGYRELYQSFIQGNGPSFFEWKMHIYGPIIGFALIF